MKKGTVLNSDISSVISRLGHTDTLVVCDAGLPIPKSTTRIDMALTQGVPSFMQVLGVVTNEMQVVLTPKSWTVKHEAYRSDS
ncbi:D-ribose pyranase, partial [Escherichia coli]|uniref:D-ribose pyranase n=3 Tax=Gammaproteobacteria TaxID=1236 RepID=UPI0018CB7F17